MGTHPRARGTEAWPCLLDTCAQHPSVSTRSLAHALAVLRQIEQGLDHSLGPIVWVQSLILKTAAQIFSKVLGMWADMAQHCMAERGTVDGLILEKDACCENNPCLLRSLVVEWLKPSEGPTLRSCVRHMFISLRTLAASTLPSSTPHWSKLLMPQIKPCKCIKMLELLELPSLHSQVTAEQQRGCTNDLCNPARGTLLYCILELTLSSAQEAC